MKKVCWGIGLAFAALVVAMMAVQKPPAPIRVATPAELKVFTGIVQGAGFNCPKAVALRYGGEDKFGKSMIVGCGTGEFRVTFRPDGSAMVQP